ncbi:RHS repeat-associated core domain-containing protein [bacterium]|nr:MAG: RHS repeat-associated core domain-containing protein [bacterium]
MSSAGVSTGYTSYYHYRADGLRAAQLRAASGTQTRITAYRYDGQMPVEEAFSFGSTVETTRFAVGPRGTERQALTTSSGTDVSYPLYDAHGNAFASIRRDASNPGGYVPLTASDVRAFDPWGNGITSTGSSTGFGMPESGRPVQAYVGSLGHRKDDETGLIYMRARYYDPQVGRFTSQDPALDGGNWFTYCGNDPVNKVDQSGKEGDDDFNLTAILVDIFQSYGYPVLAAKLIGKVINLGQWGARVIEMGRNMVKDGLKQFAEAAMEFAAMRAAGGSLGQIWAGYAGNSFRRGVMNVALGVTLITIGYMMELLG